MLIAYFIQTIISYRTMQLYDFMHRLSRYPNFNASFYHLRANK